MSEPAARSAADFQAFTIGPLQRLDGSIDLVVYDPAWPALFEREAVRIRAALSGLALLVEHVGSTSVPGLAARPRIDVVLVVPDSADEPAYVPPLERAGYVLRIREPDWFEHRVFKGPDTDVNLHTFPPACPEVERMVLFRDWLRLNDGDRLRYERTKRELAARRWEYVQHYADAKSEVVEAILAHAGWPAPAPDEVG
jgi:GrpB-like predicted nucleotidyltransferase (UPF0157 family)